MARTLSLLLTGDVMVARGIDQILATPGAPILHEPYVQDARLYVKFAEESSGPIPLRADDRYIWGPLLREFLLPGQVNLVNLETALTTSEDFCEGKGIHYRMNPKNVGCLTAAGIRCCVLANNHVLDWGGRGLEETLLTLEKAGIRHAGAGRTLEEALAPAVLEHSAGSRVLVFGAGSVTSGIPSSWAASKGSPGIALLEHHPAFVRELGERIRGVKRPGDVAVLSIHWGDNWGYEIPDPERDLAHRLIDEAGVDVIHGHSSHHMKGLEVYKGRLVLYGCGDLINDYEGIGGHEEVRPDLALLYRAEVDPSTGRLVHLGLVPAHRCRFQLQPASPEDVRWLRDLLERESLGARLLLSEEGSLSLVPG